MEDKNLKEEIQELKEMIAHPKPKKKKQFRIPFSARVSRSKLKAGYIIVQVVNENKVVTFTRQPIIDGTIKLYDTFHAIDDMDILIYKNKPMIIQAKQKLNPCNPLKGDKETYGQKYIMARMKSDAIKLTGKKLGGMLIFGLIIAGVVGYYLINGGAFS